MSLRRAFRLAERRRLYRRALTSLVLGLAAYGAAVAVPALRELAPWVFVAFTLSSLAISAAVYVLALRSIEESVGEVSDVVERMDAATTPEEKVRVFAQIFQEAREAAPESRNDAQNVSRVRRASVAQCLKLLDEHALLPATFDAASALSGLERETAAIHDVASLLMVALPERICQVDDASFEGPSDYEALLRSMASATLGQFQPEEICASRDPHSAKVVLTFRVGKRRFRWRFDHEGRWLSDTLARKLEAHVSQLPGIRLVRLSRQERLAWICLPDAVAAQLETWVNEDAP